MYITSVEILAFFYAQIQKNPKKPYPQIFIREKSFHNYFENEKQRRDFRYEKNNNRFFNNTVNHDDAIFVLCR